MPIFTLGKTLTGGLYQFLQDVFHSYVKLSKKTAQQSLGPNIRSDIAVVIKDT